MAKKNKKKSEQAKELIKATPEGAVAAPFLDDKFKQPKLKSGKASTWIIGVISLMISSAIGFFLGSLFGLIVGLLIGLAIIGLLFPKTRKLTIALILIGVIVYVVWLFYFGGEGYFATEIGSGTTWLKGQTKSMAPEIGLTKMMLTGEYDPSEIWTSKAYKDYAQGAEFEVSNVRPLRDYFSTSDNAIIIGTLKVTALPESPDKTDPIEMDIDISAQDAETGPWDCEPDRIERAEKFFGRFQCVSKTPLQISDLTGQIKQESKEVDVKVKLTDFETIAGKSTYVANYDMLNSLYLEDEDPMKHYELTKDQVGSWQSNSPINLGLGILGEKNIIAANEDKNRAPYYLGITVRNTGAGDLTQINILTIIIPQKVGFIAGKDNDFEERECRSLSTNFILCTYDLKSDKFTEKLEPGEYETFYLKFKVWEDSFLKEANIKEFFALADIKFDYEDITKVAVQVKEIG